MARFLVTYVYCPNPLYYFLVVLLLQIRSHFLVLPVIWTKQRIKLKNPDLLYLLKRENLTA